MNQQEIHEVLDAAFDAYIAIDAKGFIIEWNRQAEVMLGWSRTEAIGKSLAESIIPSQHRQAHLKGLAHFLETGEGPVLNKRIELTALRQDGGEIPVEIAIWPTRLANGFRFNAFIRDITQQKEGERARTFLASLMESARDAIIGMTVNGTILSWNQGAEKTYGYSPSEMVGKSIQLLIPPGQHDLITENLEKIRRKEPTVDYESVRIKKDGSLINVSITISPLCDASGRIIGASSIARDVTDRRRAERAFQESRAELEQFAYAVSHDLQEPLRSVAIYLQLLEEHCAGRLDAKAEDFITRSIAGAKRMRGLIGDLLDYARVTHGEEDRGQADGSVVLDQVLAGLKALIDETHAVINRDSLPTVSIRPAHLARLFQNLIGNAIKFRSPGEAPVIHVGTKRENHGVVFSIADNGIGIDPQYSERIFNIFQRLHPRTAYSGTGIGLAICKKIVERRGGSIWVESEPGKGSTFRFSIPDQ